MQIPAHSFAPAGQVPPHEAPSQVAVPPEGVAHGAHDDPHDTTSEFDAHWIPQA